MDAHLFRIFASALEPMLLGARIEKIQEFAPGHLLITFFGGAKKRTLYLRFGRSEPFCFVSSERVTAMPRPSAQIMRLRKYFANRRVAAVVIQVWSRKIWLLAAQGSEKAAPWLCLDLARGASLHFLNEEPEIETVTWPRPDDLTHAMADWRNWAVLTPALRKTLIELPPAEQAALLADLEEGGGDIFLYSDKKDVIRKIQAWPLPGRLQGELRESCDTGIMDLFEKAGHDLVLISLDQQRNQQLLAPSQRRARQIQRLFGKLEADEQRLLRMTAQQEDAALLAANLWRWAPGTKMQSVDIDGRVVSLQPQYSIAENMERMFYEAARGKRGLPLVARRRSELEAELDALRAGVLSPQATRVPTEETRRVIVSNLPRHTQAFVSSDGYIILRGKDAKGNLAIRRVASGHDVWVHVEQGAGAHVIVRRPHGAHVVPERTLIEAGTLAANKSWLSAAASGSVMYAELRHVKPCRGASPGKVTIDKLSQTMIVPVDHSLENRLASSGQPDFKSLGACSS